MELSTDNYRLIGKGRSKWKKRGGGVGVLVRQDMEMDAEEIKVGD